MFGVSSCSARESLCMYAVLRFNLFLGAVLFPVLGGSVTTAKVSGSSSVPVVDPVASHLSNEESAEAPNLSSSFSCSQHLGAY